MAPRVSGFLERAILLAPDRVARAAARLVDRPAERWIVGEPRAVRESVARQVLAAPDRDRAEQAWMLRQSDAVRASYVRDVLEG